MIDVGEELRDALEQKGFPDPRLLEHAMARLNRPRRRVGYIRPASVAASLIAAALVITLVTVRFHASPANQGPALPTSSSIAGLISYQFVSPDVGWVQLHTATDVIAKTLDGGRTWHQQLSLSGLRSTPTMQWIDDRNGVLIGQDGDSAVVWRTSDGGLHWQPHVIPVSSVGHPGFWVASTGYFLDARNGWVVFARDLGACSVCPPPGNFDQLIYATTDAEKHWTELAHLPLNEPQSEIKFVSPSRGIFMTSVGLDPIYVTEDGGHSWSKADIPFGMPTCGVASCYYFVLKQPPTFFTQDQGVLVITLCAAPPPNGSVGARCGEYGRYGLVARFLYTTADGGRTWAYSRRLTNAQGELAFVGAMDWVDVGPDGATVTRDGGKTWSGAEPIPIPAGWYVSKIRFIDTSRGWVALSKAADGGVSPSASTEAMLATSDGGATWRQVMLPQA